MQKKITVGMDISQLAHNGGVASYTDNLTRELSNLNDLDMVYFYSSLRKPYKGKLKNVKKFRLPPKFFEMLFNNWRTTPIEKFIGPVDIFHSSDWAQPPSKALKVTTYHDLVPIKYPEWSDPHIVEVHKKRLKIVEKEIDLVIAVSNATKRDLLEVSSIPEEKIVVIPEAPTANFKKSSKEQINQFKKKYNLPEKFILGIGGVGERRNLKKAKEAAKDYQMIITGENIPWLNIEELELLYSSAEVLLYPSLYEGFGLPILDAFLCQLPVITSNVSSMPEVAGDAAILVDPNRVDQIKEALNKLMEDKGLRSEMINKGLTQVKKFSWEKTARETANVYRRLINE